MNFVEPVRVRISETWRWCLNRIPLTDQDWVEIEWQDGTITDSPILVRVAGGSDLVRAHDCFVNIDFHGHLMHIPLNGLKIRRINRPKREKSK
jgi:hypothetical protein